MLVKLTLLIFVIAIVLGFAGGLVDNSFGMGYGIISMVLILLDFSLLVIVPTLLLSQATTGLTGALFHYLYKNFDFKTKESTERRVFVLFTILGTIGSLIAIFLVFTVPENIVMTYIGMMMIGIGLLVLFNIKMNDSLLNFFLIGTLAGFNKAISGGGYGPLITSGQILSGTEIRKAVGVTQLSESLLSILGFILYSIFNNFSQVILTIQLAIIMVISGVISAPLGSYLARKLKDKTAKAMVGILSISLGIMGLVKLMLL
ncbi:MAG: TSUP family transporter [Candidatus Lokiarchaeota archaeon]|nr:TSUP family transporter [Candidatus Lokiarchaeota archaeon]MBD3342640.1 TSUP family transporter [Candidatus Lokiarchaeota archaeon]